MASSSNRVGELVWAKMKGFPAWPGKVIEPKVEVKKSTRKNQHFVFFFGSENYAWLHDDNIFPYLDFKSRFLLTARIPKGFKEAVEAIEDCVKAQPKQTSYKVSELPSIDDELSQMFPSRKGKDSQSSKKRKSFFNTDPDYKSKAAVPKDRRSSAGKRKVGRPSKDKTEEANNKEDGKPTNSVSLSGGEGGSTANGRPGRRASRTASSDKERDSSLDVGLQGKHVVPYEQWVAAGDDSLTTESAVHRIPHSNIEIVDSLNSEPDLFDTEESENRKAVNNTTVDFSDEEDSANREAGKTNGGNNEADNLFEKLGFGSAMTEPSAEEMFDEMLRSSTPSGSGPSEEDKSQPPPTTTTAPDEEDRTAAESQEQETEEPQVRETEPEESNDTGEHEEPSPMKFSSTVDVKEPKSKTPVIALTGKKLVTPKRSGSPSVSTPATKKARILASPKVTTPKPTIVKQAVAAASSESKPLGLSPDASPAVGEAPPKTIIATPAKIGFLGLGIMGQGMVANLLKSGHEVTVWNRTASKCREFVKEGALKGNSPADVVAACDITFSCVSDPQALKDLVFGNSGVLQGIGSKKSYVDMSTVDVETVIDIHDAVIARGGRFLEAPVIGSKGPAQSGELVILSAGDISLHEDCFSCFQAVGKKTLYLGDIGNAARMKLVVNMLQGTLAAGLAESMALAEKIGLDQAELLRVLMLSDVASSLVDSKGSAIMNSKFETNFPLQHQQKDLRLAIDMADSVDQPMHVIAAANELFKKAKAKGYGEHDMAAVYRAADM